MVMLLLTGTFFSYITLMTLNNVRKLALLNLFSGQYPPPPSQIVSVSQSTTTHAYIISICGRIDLKHTLDKIQNDRLAKIYVAYVLTTSSIST